MSIFMESFLERHPNTKYLFTDDDDAKGPARLKSAFSKAMREDVWRTREFMDLAPEASPLDKNGWPTDIGTHSGRKCPAEYAANCGAHTIEVEIRGRWKGQKGGADYISIHQHTAGVRGRQSSGVVVSWRGHPVQAEGWGFDPDHGRVAL